MPTITTIPYSLFNTSPCATEFRKIIKKAKNVKKIDIVGCCTDICDFNGTMGLANYMDQWNRMCDIFIALDATKKAAETAIENNGYDKTFGGK